MADWVAIIKWVVLGIAAFMLLGIASGPGLTGKIFVLVFGVVVYLIYERIMRKQQAPNHLNTYFDRLRKLCRLQGPGLLRSLVLTGDYGNPGRVLGRILGGPIYEYNPKLPADHPKRRKMIYLFTPDTGWMFTVPPISWIMSAFQRQHLFALFHNPKSSLPVSQLRNKPQMQSRDKYEKEALMSGDLMVKGVNVYFVREMLYVNDELFDHDAEMARLGEHVDRLTLEDELEHLPDRIRRAVDSNSVHVQRMDLKDFIAGAARTEGSA